MILSGLQGCLIELPVKAGAAHRRPFIRQEKQNKITKVLSFLQFEGT